MCQLQLKKANRWLSSHLPRSPCLFPWVVLQALPPWKGRPYSFAFTSPAASSIVLGTLTTLWPIVESGHYVLLVTWCWDTALSSRVNEMPTGELKNNNNFTPFGWAPLKPLCSNSLPLLSGSPFSVPVSILRGPCASSQMPPPEAPSGCIWAPLEVSSQADRE